MLKLDPALYSKCLCFPIATTQCFSTLIILGVLRDQL